MTALIIGLVLFLGVHSVRIAADPWRSQMVSRVGARAYKGVYAFVSLAGFLLLLWGFREARHAPVVLWPPLLWARPLTALLTLVAFVLFIAGYVPRNSIKARLHHPMVLSVKAWAFGHLLANNTLADLLLFGAFLAWAILSFRAARARDRAAGTVYPPGTAGATVVTVVIGAVAWAAFALWVHERWLGVRPFG